MPIALCSASKKSGSTKPRQIIFPIHKGATAPHHLFGWKDNSHLWLLTFPQEKLSPGTFTQREWDVQTGEVKSITRFKEPTYPGGGTGSIQLFSPETKIATYTINEAQYSLVNLKTHEWVDLEWERPIALRGRVLAGCTDDEVRNNKPSALSIAFTDTISATVKRTIGLKAPTGRCFSCSVGEKTYDPPLVDISADKRVGAVSTLIRGTSHRDGLQIFDARTGKTLRRLQFPDEDIYQILCSPDGSTVSVTYQPTSGANNNTVSVWNTRNGKLIIKWTGNTKDRPLSIAFSPDSKRFAALHGMTGSIWDVRTSQRLQIIQAPMPTDYDYHLSLSFSPDGHTLAAFDKHRTLTLWRLK